MLRARHGWNWGQLRRRLTTANGRWLIAADGVEYFRIHRMAPEQALATLDYFDGLNFAARATVPALDWPYADHHGAKHHRHRRRQLGHLPGDG